MIALIAAGFSATHISLLLLWVLLLLCWTCCFGACLLLLAHRLTGGKWMPPVETGLRRLAAGLPFASVAFALLWLGGSDVFYWIDPPSAGWLAELARERAGFLNLPFFVLRAFFYFIVFAWAGWTLGRSRHSVIPAAPLLLLLVLTAFFFIVDWVMLRAPWWWSSVFPFTCMLVGVVGALSISLLAGRERLAAADDYARRTVGTMLFAALILFFYLGLMDFVITYAGDLPRKRLLYTQRAAGAAGWMLTAGFFAGAVPAFFSLLRIEGKTRMKPLRLAALGLFFLVFTWVWWFVAPFATPVTESPVPTSGVQAMEEEVSP